MLVSILLAGGKGSRLWPISGNERNKILQPMLDDAPSLLQQTAKRALNHTKPDHIITITSAAMVDDVARQLIAIDPLLITNIIAEPDGRDTGAACLTAALYALEHFGDLPVWITPTDHAIIEGDDAIPALAAAKAHANAGYITTFGITPTSPDSRLGYICHTSEMDNSAYNVTGFHEKPAGYEAERLIRAGRCFWNSGMFITTPSTLLGEAHTHAPLLFSASKAAFATLTRNCVAYRLDGAAYKQIPALAIDKAVMEKTNKLRVIPAPFSWADAGSWDSVWKLSHKDGAGNSTRGNVLLKNSRNSLVHAYSKKTICIGMDDLIVVETPDALLIARREQAGELKNLLNSMADGAA